jgi:succinate dehydrogenase flavin-adding protein (antitoxin of CptAB toxin-antitoxin module)
MTERTIQISEAVYARAQEIATETAQSVERVIEEQLTQAFSSHFTKLPADEQAELRALVHLSDEALWTIAREQMAPARQTRMQVLMDKNNFSTVSDDEYAELGRLVELGDQLMLRKAHAVKVLMERGYKVTKEDIKPLDE